MRSPTTTARDEWRAPSGRGRLVRARHPGRCPGLMGWIPLRGVNPGPIARPRPGRGEMPTVTARGANQCRNEHAASSYRPLLALEGRNPPAQGNALGRQIDRRGHPALKGPTARRGVNQQCRNAHAASSIVEPCRDQAKRGGPGKAVARRGSMVGVILLSGGAPPAFPGPVLGCSAVRVPSGSVDADAIIGRDRAREPCRNCRGILHGCRNHRNGWPTCDDHRPAPLPVPLIRSLGTALAARVRIR